MDAVADLGKPRYFGSPAQQRMQAAADALWSLVGGDPLYAYEGRTVGLSAPGLELLPTIVSLARLQGAMLMAYVSPEAEPELTAGARTLGLSTDRWDHFMGGARCIETCAAYVRDFPLPEDHVVHRIGPETGDAEFDRMAKTALSCGVLPPAAQALQGLSRHGVCFWLEAPDGGAAACAGAVLRGHPDSRFARSAWWGMLATRPEDRGKSLSLYLGALAVLHLHETCGAEEFFTGVRRDNHVSRHLCTKLGVVETPMACMAVVDPQFFGEDSVTK